MIKGLRTVVYRVRDVAEAKAWYGETFGIRPYFDEPFYVGFNVGGFELGMVPDPERRPPGGVSAYWGVDDVDAAVTRLVERGAAVHEKISDVGGGIRIGSVLDPFGNILGVIENPQFKLEDVR
jgi:predicted enzyme related to lactoylglutathione lyase